MKHIVILGSSAAAVTVIEELRRADPESQVTLIALDGHYPYRRDAFAAFISQEIVPEKIFCRTKDFYQQYNVTLILDKKISRINLKRKKIFAEDKMVIDYDVLIVTDTPENRFPDIKGVNKSFIYGFKKLKDVDEITGALPAIRTVVIQSDSFSGLEAAMSFIKRDKEVILVSSEKDFFTRHFSSEAAEWLLKKFEEKGLRIMRDSGVKEILGDKDAKAVRLKAGKVFSAEAIIFPEMNEDLRLFSDITGKTARNIQVNEKLQADAEQVFVVDQACNLSGLEPIAPLSVLEEQGKVVVDVINGKERSFAMPLCVRSQAMEGLAITLLGNIEEELESHQEFNPESGTCQKLYLKDHCLVGAILVNQENRKEELLTQIRQKRSFEAIQKNSGEHPEEDDSSIDSGAQDEDNVSVELVDNQ